MWSPNPGHRRLCIFPLLLLLDLSLCWKPDTMLWGHSSSQWRKLRLPVSRNHASNHFGNESSSVKKALGDGTLAKTWTSSSWRNRKSFSEVLTYISSVTWYIYCCIQLDLELYVAQQWITNAGMKWQYYVFGCPNHSCCQSRESWVK